MDKTLRTVAGAFGIHYETQAGGGGGDGKWVFTSLAELDGVIKRWTGVRDAILTRRDKIRDARNLVQPPAEDIMSYVQSNAFKARSRKCGSMRTACTNTPMRMFKN
jgi:hypothetical protein